MKNDYKYMRIALQMAEEAQNNGEIPVGAVLVRGGEVVAKERNRVQELGDTTAHAEALAIKSASKAIGEKYLSECTLYVTLEPCPMCAGAIVLSKVGRLVFGASDIKAGACGSLYMIASDKRLNHRAEITAGIMEQECKNMLKEYFANLRENK